ncbi:MAG: DUF1080 domain-containing protein [Verrucomicrobiota bacterium]
MKRIVGCLAGLLLAVALPVGAQTAETAIVPKAKVELFNGKDLTGWVAYHKTNVAVSSVWSVKDGLLGCVGKPNGYLRTDKAYANYKVTVEWRFAKPGNTGVLVHMNLPEKVWPLCVECQGMHKAQGDMYFWSGAKCNELVKPPKVGRKAPDAEKAVGEWNLYQVVCAGDTITILVNGTEMNKTTGGSIRSGFIGLQCEGAQLEVKRVTLEPL